MIALRNVTPRHHHYGVFYHLAAAPPSGGPKVAVVGNCQAESLRILLESTGAVDSFRIPPIHEWSEEDLPFVAAALATTDVLVMQPVRDNYRSLPVGTAQLAALLPRGAQLIRFPVLRYDGTNPYIAIVRSPLEPSLNPPAVAYHDIRILAQAAGLSQQRPVPESVWLHCAAQSVAQLQRREEAHQTVTISDVLATTPVWHTLNHPDNATLSELARRVVKAIGMASEVSPPADREMLGRLRAPIQPEAATALGVTEVRATWEYDGAPIPDFTAAHLQFYADHPEVVTAGLRRHADRLTTLGFSA